MFWYNRKVPQLAVVTGGLEMVRADATNSNVLVPFPSGSILSGAGLRVCNIQWNQYFYILFDPEN